MKGTAKDLRKGAVIKLKGELFRIIEYTHVTPGKGPAHHQVKLRNLQTGKLSSARFSAGDKIEFVRIEQRIYQYLYKDGPNLFFMNLDNYEQVPVEADLIGDDINFLKESNEAELAFVDDKVIGVELPPNVELEVTYTEPGVKGDTATNVTKPATLETGVEVQVPLFINEGDVIKVDTSTGEYVERVNK